MSHPGRHTVPWRPRWPPKYPRPHQPREHRTFLPRAVPQRGFLGVPVPPNKLALSSPGIRAAGKGPAQLHRAHPRFQGSHGMRPLHRPQAHARQNAPSLSPLLQPPPATQPRRGHDSYQEPPRHQAVHTRQACQMGHQEVPAVRGQEGLHSRLRNLHRPGQGPPLAPPRISRQCCPPSRGELAGHQQEPHAVHGPLLQLRGALPPAEERAGSPGRGHCLAKPQALPQGTRQEADRTWPVRIQVPGSSVCHRLERPQAHPLPEQLPPPEESVHCEQACGGPARAVDRATACGALHQVS